MFPADATPLYTAPEHQASVSGVDQVSNPLWVPFITVTKWSPNELSFSPSQKGADSRIRDGPTERLGCLHIPEGPSRIRLQRLDTRGRGLTNCSFQNRRSRCPLNASKGPPEGADGTTLMLSTRTGPAHSDPTCQFLILGPRLRGRRDDREVLRQRLPLSDRQTRRHLQEMRMRFGDGSGEGEV